jgi:hypothetical protein
MPVIHPFANRHLWEWWLNDYINSTVSVQPMGDVRSKVQQTIDAWGANRRRLLTWAEKLEIPKREEELG